MGRSNFLPAELSAQFFSGCTSIPLARLGWAVDRSQWVHRTTREREREGRHWKKKKETKPGIFFWWESNRFVHSQKKDDPHFLGSFIVSLSSALVVFFAIQRIKVFGVGQLSRLEISGMSLW